MPKAIIVDLTNLKIWKEDVECDFIVREGMYYQIPGHGMTPAAYVFPQENKLGVESVLAELRANKKRFDDEQSRIFYKVMPQLRRL